MAHDSVMERVGRLEKTVAALTGLPGEVSQLSRRVGTMESQIVQLRTEMKDEFFAVRRELAAMRGEQTELRGELDEHGGGLAELRGDLAETRDNLLGVIERGSQATQEMFDEVREDIRAFRQETNSRFDGLSTQMRVLHEDVIERISRLGGR